MALFSCLRASLPPHSAADPFVLSPVLKACTSAADADPGFLFLPHAAAMLHAFAVRSSAVMSVFVSTALADAYAKAGTPRPGAQCVRRNALQERGLVDHARRLAGAGRLAPRRTLPLHRDAGLRRACDSQSYAAALTACADSGLLSRGREVHALCAKLGLDATPYVANTLATLYARCGHIDRALAVASRMGLHDVAAWTTLIASYL